MTRREPAGLALALFVVDAAALLAPAGARAGLRGEWKAELCHRAHLLRRDGRWGAKAAAALLVRSLGTVADALDLRFCGPDGAADPWMEGARVGARAARFAGALLCTALAVAVGAFACALASILPGNIHGATRTFIVATGALWSGGLAAASAGAAYRILPADARGRLGMWLMGGAWVFGLAFGVAGARYAAGAAPHSALAASGLPARTALACAGVWAVSALAFAALHRWRPADRAAPAGGIVRI